MEHTGNKQNRILPILILAVSVFLTAGVKVIFSACGMHDDGTYGSCHWAEQAVMAAGIIVAFQALMLVAGKAAAVQKALSFTVLVSAVVFLAHKSCGAIPMQLMIAPPKFFSTDLSRPARISFDAP